MTERTSFSIPITGPILSRRFTYRLNDGWYLIERNGNTYTGTPIDGWRVLWWRVMTATEMTLWSFGTIRLWHIVGKTAGAKNDKKVELWRQSVLFILAVSDACILSWFNIWCISAWLRSFRWFIELDSHSRCHYTCRTGKIGQTKNLKSHWVHLTNPHTALSFALNRGAFCFYRSICVLIWKIALHHWEKSVCYFNSSFWSWNGVGLFCYDRQMKCMLGKNKKTY